MDPISKINLFCQKHKYPIPQYTIVSTAALTFTGTVEFTCPEYETVINLDDTYPNKKAAKTELARLLGIEIFRHKGSPHYDKSFSYFNQHHVVDETKNTATNSLIPGYTGPTDIIDGHNRDGPLLIIDAENCSWVVKLLEASEERVKFSRIWIVHSVSYPWDKVGTEVWKSHLVKRIGVESSAANAADLVVIQLAIQLLISGSGLMGGSNSVIVISNDNLMANIPAVMTTLYPLVMIDFRLIRSEIEFTAI